MIYAFTIDGHFQGSWPSQKDLMQEVDVPPDRLNKVVKGTLDHYHGVTFIESDLPLDELLIDEVIKDYFLARKVRFKQWFNEKTVQI